MTEKQTNGQKSELLAEYYLIGKGYVVSKPINDFSEYDFIIDNDGVLCTVQVKTIYFDNSKKRWLSSCVTSHIRGNNRRTNKKYTEKSFDYGLFVCKEYRKAYLVPIALIAGRRSITFYPDSDSTDGFEFYKDAIE